MPGSLLAVDRRDAAKLLPRLGTVPGRKILSALRDYGGYLVDDTASNDAAFCAEHEVNAEIMEHYGWDPPKNTQKTGAIAIIPKTQYKKCVPDDNSNAPDFLFFLFGPTSLLFPPADSRLLKGLAVRQ